jgi:hypothetical protein
MNTSKSTTFVLPVLFSIAFTAAAVVHDVQAQPASATPQKPDPAAVEFLIAAAAEDFRASTSAGPVAIRKARVGYFPEGGTGRYLLCGSFKSHEDKGSEWIQFATIKTSPYEQWIGGMAEAQCANKRIKWYGAEYANELMQRVRGK